MYKSPLQAFYKEQAEKVDDLCYRGVLSVGINVDREELLKALEYDRGQYEKGFEDGLQYARETYCSICYAKMGERRNDEQKTDS